MSDLRSHALLGLDARQREAATAVRLLFNSVGEQEEAHDEQSGEREVTEHFLSLLAASESISTSIATLRMLGYFWCVWPLVPAEQPRAVASKAARARANV